MFIEVAITINIDGFEWYQCFENEKYITKLNTAYDRNAWFNYHNFVMYNLSTWQNYPNKRQ